MESSEHQEHGSHGVQTVMLEPESGLNLRRYGQVLVKRKWLILGVLAIVFGVAALYTYRLIPVYEAKLTVIVDMSPPKVLGGNVREVVDLGSGHFFMSKEYLTAQKTIIKSRELSTRVVDEQQLHQLPDFWYPHKFSPTRTRDQAVARLMRLINVGTPPNNRLLEISVRHAKPKMAARLCNAVGDAYLAFNLDYKLGSTKDAVKWLADQLDDLKKDLTQAELALHQFKKSNNVLSVPMEDKQNLLTRRIESLNEELTKMRARRMELAARRRQILGARHDDPLKDSAILAAENPTVAELKRTYAEERRKLVELKERYLAKHPLVKAQEAKLEATDKSLRREIDNAVAVAEAKFREVKDAEGQLAGALESAKKEAFDLNLKQIDYNRLKRTQDNTEKLYGLVLGRLKESDLSANLRVNNVRILDRATAPGAPIFPNVRRYLMLALVLGLLGGIGLAALVEVLDNTIKTQEEIEAITGVPFLGILPSIEDALVPGGAKAATGVDPNKDLYLHTHPKSSVAECARSIRTNLLFMSPEEPLKTLLVTSPGPREGKSTTAISLAVAMAQGSQKVLLIDTDLRRPRLHRTFGVSSETGLTSVLMGHGTLSDVIKTTEVPGLWVLPCGPLPPNPAELLHTERFSSVLDELKGRFDRIVFDSPPVIAVTDAAVLAARLDGVLLVVKSGQTVREGLRRSVRVLGDVGARVLGCVFNDLDLSRRANGQYYYYYYRRYGYSYQPETEPADGPRPSA